MDIKSDQSMEQLIIETAERMFLERGFTLTSTTEIAKAVGCNQALVHYYFRTKDNLFNTIFEQKFRLFFHHVFELGNLNKLSFNEKLKHIIESHFDMLRANPKLPLLIIGEFSRRPEQIDRLKEKLQGIPQMLFEKLNTELEAEIEAGRIRQTSLLDLLLTTLSINVSLFLLMPIFSQVMAIDENQQGFLIEHRKQEHVAFILNSLRA